MTNPSIDGRQKCRDRLGVRSVAIAQVAMRARGGYGDATYSDWSQGTYVAPQQLPPSVA